MNIIFTQHLLDPQPVPNTHFVIDKDRPMQTLTNKLIHQVFATAHLVMYAHAQKALHEKYKLLSIQGGPKHTSNLDTIINAIQTRESNVVQRIEYDTQQEMKMLFDTPKDKHVSEHFRNSIPS